MKKKEKTAFFKKSYIVDTSETNVECCRIIEETLKKQKRKRRMDRMKDVVLEEENGKKVFTKNKAKDIINKNYNPFEVNCRIYKRRDGLYMKNKILLDEVIKELNFIERIFFKKKFIKIYKKGIEKGFNSRM